MDEAKLKEIHEELSDRLEMVYGKPVMITITYLDKNTSQLEHWAGLNNEFKTQDIALTLEALKKQLEEKYEPKNIEVMRDFRQQIHNRKRQRLRLNNNI